jgi:hypothetical protein
MPNTPATLTQYVEQLLLKEENREKFNAFSEAKCQIHWTKVVYDSKASLQFSIGDKTKMNFNFLNEIYQKEIICIALKSLDEFQVEPKLSSTMLNWIVDYKRVQEDGDENTAMAEYAQELTPKTLAKKYGSMLYDKSIEEIDEIFKSENICI